MQSLKGLRVPPLVKLMAADGGSLEHLNGTTTFFQGQYDASSVTVTICCALAIYNAIELVILIFATFHRYAGLYFWSLLVASLGILPYVVGFMCEYFRLANREYHHLA